MESRAVSNSALVLSNYSFATSQDIQTIVENPEAQEVIKSIEKTYYTINVSTAMQNLRQVGDLLHLAYAGSKTFPCNEQVVAIAADYQTLIKDSHVAMNAFLLTCVGALKKHKLAIAYVRQEKFEKALKIIEGCAVMAEKMAATSGELAEQSQNLCTKSRAALLAATHDGTVSEEKKKRIRDQIIALDAKEERLKQLTHDLAKQVQEEKDREREIAKQEKKARNRAFVVKVIASAMTPVTSVGSALVAPVTVALKIGGRLFDTSGQATSESIVKQLEANKQDLENIAIELAEKEKLLEQAKSKNKQEEVDKLEIEITKLQARRDVKNKAVNDVKDGFQTIGATLDKEAEYLRTKGEAIASTRAQLQNEEREANADLAESVSNLKNLNVETDTLDQAVASLDLCVKTMGKIKTVFENARLYWLGVATHCKGLTDISDLSDSLELGGAEFEDALQECVWSWLTLGRQNLLACKAIEAVNSHVDNFIGNLPSREESAKLIKKIEIFGIEGSHT